MICPHCGTIVPEDQVFCGQCGMRAAGGQTAVGEAPGGRRPTDWEARAEIGFFRGLVRSIGQVLFHPAAFFRNMPVTGGLSDPLLFALITGMTGMTLSFTWQILLQGSLQGVLPPDVARYGSDAFEGLSIAALAVLTPLLLIIGVFIGAGFLHVLLLLVRGANAGFEATFRVVCYSFGTYVFLALPFCGGLLASVWMLVVSITGLREAHGTSGGKAAFAVLFPLLLFCGILLLFVLLFMGVLAATFGLTQQ